MCDRTVPMWFFLCALYTFSILFHFIFFTCHDWVTPDNAVPCDRSEFVFFNSVAVASPQINYFGFYKLFLIFRWKIRGRLVSVAERFGQIKLSDFWGFSLLLIGWFWYCLQRWRGRIWRFLKLYFLLCVMLYLVLRSFELLVQ